MSRNSENIYKRKNGGWEGKYIKGQTDGKTEYGYSAPDVKGNLSAEKIDDLSRDTELNEYNSMIYPFSYAANEWAAACSCQWKLSSQVKYRSILNNYLLPEYGHKNINEISRGDVSAYISRLLTKGGRDNKGLAPKTVNSIISVMKNVFEYAAENKGCSLISFKGLNAKQEYKSVRTLTMTEQNILSKYLADNKNLTSLGILICLYTGLRVGEICALKWGDISFDDKCIYVNKTMQRLQTTDACEHKTRVIITEPKSNCSKRVIPIPYKLLNIMKEFKNSSDAYVLTGMPNCYTEPRTMQNRFKSVIKKCGIKSTNFHTLRHTFATRCIELGFDIKSLSEILGHASVSITLNIYVHPSMEIKQKNMNMLSDLLAVE